jgi:hypothetical protein
MRVQRVATQARPIPQSPPDPVLTCANPDCRAPFTPDRKWQKFHSDRCRFRHWSRRDKSAPTKPHAEGTAPPPPRGGSGRLVIDCIVCVELLWH